MRIATVIPVYQPELSPMEARRLIRTFANIEQNDCFFVGPSYLNAAFLPPLMRQFPLVGFPDYHFRSVRTYSEWMLEPDLYAKFSDYEFLLVCQLDAVLVEPLPVDENWDFDYLGAPWNPPWALRWNPVTGRFSKRVPRILERRLSVGNGGLSLRRPDVFKRIRRPPRLKHFVNEDIVISYFHRQMGIRLAPVELAAQIFMETAAASWLPGEPIPSVCGFHALEKFNPLLEEAILS